MKAIRTLICLSALILPAVFAHGEFVQLFKAPGDTESATFTLASGEAAEVKYLHLRDSGMTLEVDIADGQFTYTEARFQNDSHAVFVAGPATITIHDPTGTASPGYCSLKVYRPESQPLPSTVAVIPTDAEGTVEVVLEASEDLVNWALASPGAYGLPHQLRFFRVRIIKQAD